MSQDRQTKPPIRCAKEKALEKALRQKRDQDALNELHRLGVRDKWVASMIEVNPSTVSYLRSGDRVLSESKTFALERALENVHYRRLKEQLPIEVLETAIVQGGVWNNESRQDFKNGLLRYLSASPNHAPPPLPFPEGVSAVLASVGNPSRKVKTYLVVLEENATPEALEHEFKHMVAKQRKGQPIPSSESDPETIA